MRLIAPMMICGAALVLLSPQAPPESPRLAALAAEAGKGDAGAVVRFWREAAEKKTPLVEPVPGDPENVLVTFLHRGGGEVKNVVIFIDRGLWGEIPSNTLARLDGTDVWYRTYRMRRDARFTYAMSVNDSLVPLRGVRDASEWIKRSAGWTTDPLNPKRFPSYPSPLSVVELPGAPAQPWVAVRADAPKGRLRTQKIKSALLGSERTVWVYEPPGGPETAAPGILVLFDGGAYTSWVPTPTILDNLLAERRIPPLVAVMVGHPAGARDRELTCSEPFTRFLAEELLPWLRTSYRVTTDPALTVVGGSSYGGLGAAFAAFRRPDIFGAVLSQSGGFMYSPPGEPEPSWLADRFAASPRLPIRFHLDCGLMEDQPTEDGSPNIVAANRRLRDVLKDKGYEVHYREFNGGHEYLNWRGTLADGLIALLGGR